MSKTRPSWWNDKGAKRVKGPRRDPLPARPKTPYEREYPRPYRRLPEPLPGKPGVPNDPRFLPGGEYGPPLPERGPRPMVRRNPVPFGRKIPRLRVPLGRFLPIWEFIDFVDPYFATRKDPVFKVPAGWVKCCGPSAMPLRAYVYASISNTDSWCGNCGYTGQAISGTKLWDQGVVGPLSRRIARVSRKNPPGAGGGFAVHDVWHKPGGGTQTQPLRTVRTISLPGYPNPFMPANPNQSRWEPVGDPLTGTQTAPCRVCHAHPGGPVPFANPHLAYEPDFAWQWVPGFGMWDQVKDDVRPFVRTPNNTPVTHPNPIRREPPARGERHAKAVTKSKIIMIATFKALDAVSEAAEVVDALYDALPKDVTRRWNRAHSGDASYRRLLDSAGQYGIDGADWKLQALYWNWHKLDVEAAIRNIIKNELSDRVIGGINRELPANWGNASAQGDKELSEILDGWFKEVYGL